MTIAFWLISAVTVVGALLAVTLRNLVHCVLALVLFFLGIAGHYFLLRADFLGAVQILIYIGAVAVLILFAIMLTRNVTGRDAPRGPLSGGWLTGVAVAVLVGGLVVLAIYNEPAAARLPGGEAVGAVATIGRLLVTDWLVPFEAMAVLLTAALVGAVIIAIEEVVKKP